MPFIPVEELPLFKCGDRVRTRHPLKIAEAQGARLKGMRADDTVQGLYHAEYKEIDYTAVLDLPVKAGLLLEIVAVKLSEDDLHHATMPAQYKLELDAYSSRRDDDTHLTPQEYDSLLRILDEDDLQPRFILYASEDQLELVSACDGRSEDGRTATLWEETEDTHNWLEWEVTVRFPEMHQARLYHMEASLGERIDDDSDNPPEIFELTLSPLFANDAKPGEYFPPLVHLQVFPYFDADQGYFETLIEYRFLSQRPASLDIDIHDRTIDIDLHFAIELDSAARAWRYIEPVKPPTLYKQVG